MEKRQEELLNLVIESYIQTAEPVGSKFLAYKEKIGWSEATIRNDLRALEEAGFLTHPHTSAGRIPTELGYRFYVNALDPAKVKLNTKENDKLESIFKDSTDREIIFKTAAKETSAVSHEAVIVAFTLDRIYYTGFSHLFEKPEFVNSEMVINTSRMFDSCEECLARFADKITKEPRVYVGSEHTFGNYLSLAAMPIAGSKEGMFIVLGPLRMDYKKNLAIVNKINSLM